MSSRDEMSRLLVAIRGPRLQVPFAALVGLTQAKVSRLERGDGPPLDPEAAAGYAAAAGADAEQTARLVELAEAKTSAHVTTRAVLIRNAAVTQARIRDYVAGATQVWSWTSDSIPAALQTDAQTQAILDGDGEGDPGEDWWRARREHRAMLSDPGRSWRFLLYEGALRWTLGSPSVQAAQVRDIARVAREFQHVDVAVIPMDTLKPTGAAFGFHLYLGGTNGDVGEVATDLGTHFPTAKDDVAYLNARFNQLWALADQADDVDATLERIARAVSRGHAARREDRQ